MLAKRHHLLVAAATLTLGLLGTAANAAEIFSLTSTTFKDGTMMPKNASNSAANAPTNRTASARMSHRNSPGPACRKVPRASR